MYDEVNAQICSDCLMFLSYGDLPLDDDDRCREIEQGCEGFSVVLDSDDEGSFSWSGCDCCKQKGARVYDVILWDPRS